MIERLSIKIANLLLENHVIEKEDIEIYEVGAGLFFTYSMNILTTLLIACIAGLPFEGVLFSIAFILMRHNNGGAHASSGIMCYFLGMLSVAVCLVGINLLSYANVGPLFVCLSLIPVSLTILVLSPVEDQNKPLDDLERVVYRRRGILVLGICVCTALLFLPFGLLTCSYAISSAILLTSVSMVVGYIKNFRLRWSSKGQCNR